MTAVALLHGGAPLAPHDLWSAWGLDPLVIAGLGVTAVLYARGMARLRARRGRRWRARRLEAALFWTGWAALALALVSPLHPLGEALLSAHMAQHELIMAVAAPLLVLGRPLMVSLWGLPPAGRRAVGGWVGRLRPLWRAVSRLEIAWLLHALAIVGWHVPGLYQRTVDSDLVHAVQHSSFLFTGLVFWWSVLPGATLRCRHGAAILSLFATMVYTGGIGALLTLGGTVWYPAYGAAAPLWGLTPLEDQRLAGLIMWVPGGISYVLATLWLVLEWLRVSEARAVRLDQLRAPGAVALLLLSALLPGCERPSALSAAEAALVVGGDSRRGAAAHSGVTAAAPAMRSTGFPALLVRSAPRSTVWPGAPYVAGVLTNTPSHLVRWIQDPRGVDSLTAMPDMGIASAEARDIAAFLYTRPWERLPLGRRAPETFDDERERRAGSAGKA